MTRIMVTNDDGMSSIGLHVLARAMRVHGDVVVIAPDSEYSGAGAAVGALHLIQPQARRISIDGIDEAWCINGPPALCTLFARMGVFGTIDLVVSGINPGANVGRAIYHSGTVGAALTAAINGVSALAVSLDVGLDPAEDHHWDTAAALVGDTLKLLADLPAGSVLNLNVPNVASDQVKPVQWAALADFGVVQSRVERLRDGFIDVTTVAVDTELEPGTDAALLAEGHATLTALRSVSEVPRADLPSLS